MTMEQEGHNTPGGLPLGTLLRMAADGELSPEQEAALRTHLEAHPEDAERIDFERRLRGACGCACAGSDELPKGLRERILAACREENIQQADAAPAVVVTAGADTTSRGFWAGRFVARFGAIAAAVALMAVMGFLVVQSRSPDPISAGPPDVRQVTDNLARFVRKEHARCDDSSLPGADAKFTIHDPAELPEAFASLVGRPHSLQTVMEAGDHGLRFKDAGVCYPPGGQALHIRFTTADPADGPVSLWIQADDGSLGIEDGVTYTCGDGGECVRIWRCDGVRYALVCPGGGAFAGEALQCPKATKPI